MPSREWKRRIVGLKTQTRFSNWLHPLTDTKQLIFSWNPVCFWNSYPIQEHGGENGDEEKARGSQVAAIGPVNVLHPHLIQMFKLGHRGHGGVVLMVNLVHILRAIIANFLENFYDAFDLIYLSGKPCSQFASEFLEISSQEIPNSQLWIHSAMPGQFPPDSLLVKCLVQYLHLCYCAGGPFLMGNPWFPQICWPPLLKHRAPATILILVWYGIAQCLQVPNHS